MKKVLLTDRAKKDISKLDKQIKSAIIKKLKISHLSLCILDSLQIIIYKGITKLVINIDKVYTLYYY